MGTVMEKDRKTDLHLILAKRPRNNRKTDLHNSIKELVDVCILTKEDARDT